MTQTPTDKSALLPCPLCREKGEPDPEGWGSETETGPACNRCGLSTLTAEDWNRLPRTQPKETPSLLEFQTSVLLPCPFCGNAPKVWNTGRVGCNNAGCVIYDAPLMTRDRWQYRLGDARTQPKETPMEGWDGPCNQCGGFGGHEEGCTGHKPDRDWSRQERLEAALQRIIEWCDGIRGPEDHERTPYETIRDCAFKALAYGEVPRQRQVPTDEERWEVLRDLAAIVRGECPSLLNEDSGGDADLDARINAALVKPTATPAAPAQDGLRGRVEEVVRKMKSRDYEEEGPRHPQWDAQLGDVSHYRDQVQADLEAALAALSPKPSLGEKPQ